MFTFVLLCSMFNYVSVARTIPGKTNCKRAECAENKNAPGNHKGEPEATGFPKGARPRGTLISGPGLQGNRDCCKLAFVVKQVAKVPPVTKKATFHHRQPGDNPGNPRNFLRQITPRQCLILTQKDF